MNFVLKGVVAVSLLRVVNSNERRHGILMTEKKGTKWLVFAAFWVGGSNATYPESVKDYVIYSLWHWSLNYPHIYHENDSFSCNMNRKMRGKLIRGLRASYSAACINCVRTPIIWHFANEFTYRMFIIIYVLGLENKHPFSFCSCESKQIFNYTKGC